MKKLIFLTISFMISCISVYSQPTAPWSGDGTTGKPYLINNIVDLQYLADQTYLD